MPLFAGINSGKLPFFAGIILRLLPLFAGFVYIFLFVHFINKKEGSLILIKLPSFLWLLKLDSNQRPFG